MMAEWLGEALVVLPILLLLPLIWLVLGFFTDSVGNDAPPEVLPKTRAEHLQHAAIWVVITAWWGYMLAEKWRDPEPDWFMAGLFAIAVGGGLFEIISTLRKAQNPVA